jgi:hypothetical protein
MAPLEMSKNEKGKNSSASDSHSSTRNNGSTAGVSIDDLTGVRQRLHQRQHSALGSHNNDPVYDGGDQLYHCISHNNVKYDFFFHYSKRGFHSDKRSTG